MIRRGAAVMIVLVMLTLTACGKSEFGVSENTGKQMIITARNAQKDAFFMVGSLELAAGEQVVIASALKKGSVRVELVAASEEQSIDKLPDMNGIALFSAVVSGTESAAQVLPAGRYLLRASCLEKATGSIQIEAQKAPASEAPVSRHKIKVADQSVTAFQDPDGGEYRTVIPKLIVDGKDAEAINAALREHISTHHPLTQTEYGVTGEETRYAWGVRGDVVSIVVIASETFTDGVGYEVFNYNADRLAAADNKEVLEAFGMSADAYGARVAEAYRVYWDGRPYLQEHMSDLDKSIAAISLENTAPFVTPSGHLGAAGRIYVTGSQFAESVKCFDLDTLELEYFANA